MRNWMMRLVAAGLLTGCASSGLQPPPPIPDANNTATVVVIRPKGSNAAAISTEVTFDGHSLGRIEIGRNMSFRVSSGRHTLSILSSSLALTFERGKCYYFRVGYTVNNVKVAIERIRPRDAEAEVADTSPLWSLTPECTS